MGDKYDISKSYKLSHRSLAKIDYLVKEKNLKSDSEAVRFCIDTVNALLRKGHFVEVMSKLMEDID